MYALDAKKYTKLTEFEPLLRRWIRLWLDGMHAGTHVHWRLSPFSVFGLAKTWRYLSSLDHWQPQRKAIISMASRRSRKGIFCEKMPSVADEPEKWEQFFTKQLDDQPSIVAEAIGAHRKGVIDPTLTSISQTDFWIALNDLASALIAEGYSTDDLFNRVMDGVIDEADIQGGTVTERLLGFLDYFGGPESREYIVWTTIHSDTRWSGVTAKRFSILQFEHPWDLHGQGPVRVFLQREGTKIPAIISRVQGTYSVKERHRLEALAALEQRMSSAAALGQLTLDASTDMVLSDHTDRKPWRYTRKPYALPMLSAHEGLRVAHAARELFDRPERVIDEVFRAFEHSGHAEFWETVPSAYHRLLRTDLGKAIHAYRARIGGVFKNHSVSDVPVAARIISDEVIGTHEQLLAKLRELDASGDEVLAERLDEVVCWRHFQRGLPLESKVYNSVHEFADLLRIAKGFRNALAHSSTVPLDMYAIAVYLATVMTYAFSCQRRDVGSLRTAV